MFDRITIQHQRLGNADSPLDIGFLAEAMLFYGRVEIRATKAVLKQLCHEFGIEVLIDYLHRGYLVIHYEPNLAGIQTENSGTRFERHRASLVQVQGRDRHDVIHAIVSELATQSARACRLSHRLSDIIRDWTISTELLNRFESNLADPSYPVNAVRVLLGVHTPEFVGLAGVRFLVISLGDGSYAVETNLDFRRLNELYHRRIPVSHSSLDSGFLLSQMLIAQKMAEDAGEAHSEIAVADTYARVISLKISSVIQKRRESADQISSFQDLVFDSGCALAEAISSGRRTFRDLLSVLDKTAKFKTWLQNDKPTASLVKEYHRAVTANSWIDKLPTKMLRWVVFTDTGAALDAYGAGGFGTAAGVALSAADAFFVDKIAKGWKPNQFVEGTLRRLVQSGDR